MSDTRAPEADHAGPSIQRFTKVLKYPEACSRLLKQSFHVLVSDTCTEDISRRH